MTGLSVSGAGERLRSRGSPSVPLPAQRASRRLPGRYPSTRAEPVNPAWDSLAEAWEQVRSVDLLSMRDAGGCRARRVIDEAVAVVLGVGAETVSRWRAMPAAEPTETSRRVGQAGS